MSKLILILSLLALAYSQGSFNGSYTPGASTDGKRSLTGEVDVTLNKLDSSLVDIAWCGENKNVIFFLTERNTVYRSVDDGQTGHKMTEYLHKLGKKEIKANNASAVGEVFAMQQSPLDKNMMIMLGTKGINWVTENCGETFKAMDQGRPVTELQFHPTEKNWFLAAAWTVCDDFEGEPCKKYKEVFVTKDLGETWSLIEDYVFQFSWGFISDPTSEVPKERIIITHDPTHKGHQKLTGWSEKLQVSYSDDFYKSAKVLAKGGNKFLLTSYFLFVVVAPKDGAEGVSLSVADPGDKTYLLRSVNLPVKKLLDHSYTILDTSEHSVFLHVNHDGDQSRYGNIYVSDSKGTNYSLALKANVRDVAGQCDFERLQGLDGIYLANVYEKQALANFKRGAMEEIPHQRGGSKKVSEIADKDGSKGKKSSDAADKAVIKTIEDYKKTVISFNKGGAWGPLTPPKKDSAGQRVVCENTDDVCSLHLHSISNQVFGPFYSSANSLGVILGTGNVGSHLSNKPDEINTYLSRDGGLTWNEIAKGSHIYEIGDHGSLLIMASNQQAVTEIMISWNEGLTWEYLKISDVPIEIENIITEPSNTAEKFIIYGRAKGDTSGGVVIAADFTPRHQRWCKLADQPNSPESDFETWTPNGKVSPYCLLGRQVSYTRKKREAECFNNEEHETMKYIKACECTDEDWECDFGYTRSGSGPCLPENDKIAASNGVPPEQCDGVYYITQGYRKVGGNSCAGGVNHSPIEVKCPGTVILSAKNFFLMGFLLLGVWGLMKFGNESNVQKAKDFSKKAQGWFELLVGQISTRLPKTLAKGPAGFRRIDEIPDSLREDDNNDFANIAFDDHDHDDAEARIPVEEDEERNDEEIAVLETVKGKRMTGRNGYEAATKHVPKLNKPKEFNRTAF